MTKAVIDHVVVFYQPRDCCVLHARCFLQEGIRYFVLAEKNAVLPEGASLVVTGSNLEPILPVETAK